MGFLALVKVNWCKWYKSNSFRPGPNDHRSIVVEDALRDFAAGRGPRPAFFYCSRSAAEPARSDPKLILACLARQLSNIDAGQPVPEPTLQIYEKKEAQAFASGSLTIVESCDLIVQLTRVFPLMTIVIDALDECNPDKRADLLDALEAILRDSKNIIKIFVSSRNDQDIIFHLKPYPNLEISSDRNSDDIKSFVETETKRLIQRGKMLRNSSSKKDLEQIVVRKVVEGASGM